MPELRKRKRPRPTCHPARDRAPGLYLMDFLDPPRDLYLRPGAHYPRHQPNQNGKLRRSDLSELRGELGGGGERECREENWKGPGLNRGKGRDYRLQGFISMKY